MPNLTRAIAVLLISVTMVGIYAPRQASAALQEVGPIDPNSGFPLWYRDANGISLDLMEAADPFGISDPVDPANPFSGQIGFNAEGFYWSADASFDNGAQTGLLVLALEAAFAGPAAVDGEQSVFGRIRYRIDGLTPAASYTIRHPYGTATEIADAAGSINVTNDIGCFAQAGILTCDPNNPPANPHNFGLALQSGIGPFLTWDSFGPTPDPLLVNPANPNRRYLGNPAVAHAITGSPVGQNLFSVEGPGLLAGTQTNLFTVTGRLADVTPPVITVTGNNPASVTQGLAYTDAGATALDDMDGDVTASVVVTGLPIDTNVLGANTVTYTVTDAAGNTATATRTVNVVAAPLIPGVTVNSQTAVVATPTITGTVTDPTATVSVVVDAQPAVNATVNPDGTWSATVATALVNGTYDVQASATNANGTGTDATVGELIVNVGAVVPVLTTINVTPAAPSIAPGATQQFTASALDQNGSAMNPQPAFTWTSGTPATGTIDANGLFTAVADGTSVITATSGAINGTATVTVAAVVTPPPGGGGGGGTIPPQPADTKAPESNETVFRFFNKKKGTYFFTASETEKDEIIAKLGKEWAFEGEVFKVFGSNAEGSTPVFRFFNKKKNIHFFTASETEKEELIKKAGDTWRFEGEAYNVFSAEVEGTVPVFRLFNKKKGTHLFTTSASERDKLKADKNWRDEGIAWHTAR